MSFLEVEHYKWQDFNGGEIHIIDPKPLKVSINIDKIVTIREVRNTFNSDANDDKTEYTLIDTVDKFSYLVKSKYESIMDSIKLRSIKITL